MVGGEYQHAHSRDRIPLCYYPNTSAGSIFPLKIKARATVLKVVFVFLHGLRRHAATFAFRSGTPIYIVSKVIMRHPQLSTTQRYLEKVTDVEAMRRIENLYG